jgi:hypothetical protein
VCLAVSVCVFVESFPLIASLSFVVVFVGPLRLCVFRTLITFSFSFSVFLSFTLVLLHHVQVPSEKRTRQQSDESLFRYQKAEDEIFLKVSLDLSLLLFFNGTAIRLVVGSLIVLFYVFFFNLLSVCFSLFPHLGLNSTQSFGATGLPARFRVL